MSSRKVQKERARQERLAKEQQRRRNERRRRLRFAVAALIAVAAVAALVVLRPWDAQRGDAFGYSSADAPERAARAGLRPGDGPHVHPKLNVVVRDATIQVPGEMGIGAAHAPMHTHESDGTIHVEGAEEGTLGQFMALWGVAFGRDRLGPFRSGGGERVRMWVKAPAQRTFKEVAPSGSLKLVDGQELYLFFGRPSQAPIA